MSARSFLKQAGGSSLDNPATDVDDLAILPPALASSPGDDQAALDALPDERVPKPSPSQNPLSYTQELPVLEQLFAALASSSLRSSGVVSSSFSLDDVLSVLSGLLQQAVADNHEERVTTLLALQDRFSQLPAELSSSSSSPSSSSVAPLRASSDIYLTRPSSSLNRSTPLRRSHRQFVPSSSSSSSSSTTTNTSSSSSSSFSSQPCSSSDVPCPICYDDFPFDALTSLEDCRQHRYCAGCLGAHLSAQINEAQVARLACPGLNCAVLASEQDVLELVPPQVYDRYLKFSVFAYYKEERPLECPNPACQSPLFPAERHCRGERFPECPACWTEFCTVCLRVAHPDTDCSGEDFSLATWRESKAKNTVKKCYSCQTYVEKNLGCNHITCKCQAQWCWLCEDNYITGHFSEGPCASFQFDEANDLLTATKAKHTKDVMRRVGHKYIRELSARHNAEYHRWCIAHPPTLRVGRKWKRTPAERAEWEIQKQIQTAEFEALVQLQSIESQRLLEKSLNDAQAHLDAVKLKRESKST